MGYWFERCSIMFILNKKATESHHLPTKFMILSKLSESNSEQVKTFWSCIFSLEKFEIFMTFIHSNIIIVWGIIIGAMIYYITVIGVLLLLQKKTEERKKNIVEKSIRCAHILKTFDLLVKLLTFSKKNALKQSLITK